MHSNLDYQAIQERVNAGILKRKTRTRLGFFFATLLSYMVLFVTGFSAFKNNPVAAMFLLAFAGFLGLIFQGLSLALDSKRWEELTRERLVTQEVNHEMLRVGLSNLDEPAKRKGMMRLTDDGELEEIVEEQTAIDDTPPLQRQR